jgi:putative component of toxin-antitoxin plasmid stabilization module
MKCMFSVLQTQEFQDWLDGLKDIKARLRIVARLRLAEAGSLGRDIKRAQKILQHLELER